MGLKARYVLLSTVSALALSGPASAQGIWSGFYIGGHGGIGWLHHEQTITGPIGATCINATPATCDLKTTGAVLGGQIGYNWQQAQWVFGLEGDASWTSLKKSESFTPFANFSHIINDRIDWLASVRGRLGWANGDILFYATGGVAFANFNAGWFRIGGPARAQFDETTVGWVAGGGIEKMFNRNWSARAEFLHYGLGKTSRNSSLGAATYTTAFRHDVSVVRLGISYRP
jgi:outer membrane immunogenic protein